MEVIGPKSYDKDRKMQNFKRLFHNSQSKLDHIFYVKWMFHKILERNLANTASPTFLDSFQRKFWNRQFYWFQVRCLSDVKFYSESTETSFNAIGHHSEALKAKNSNFTTCEVLVHNTFHTWSTYPIQCTILCWVDWKGFQRNRIWFDGAKSKNSIRTTFEEWLTIFYSRARFHYPMLNINF